MYYFSEPFTCNEHNYSTIISAHKFLSDYEKGHTSLTDRQLLLGLDTSATPDTGIASFSLRAQPKTAYPDDTSIQAKPLIIKVNLEFCF